LFHKAGLAEIPRRVNSGSDLLPLSSRTGSCAGPCLVLARFLKDGQFAPHLRCVEEAKLPGLWIAAREPRSCLRHIMAGLRAPWYSSGCVIQFSTCWREEQPSIMGHAGKGLCTVKIENTFLPPLFPSRVTERVSPLNIQRKTTVWLIPFL
jgi:hypothetical protein